jgi:uracil-DNA glycosylase
MAMNLSDQTLREWESYLSFLSDHDLDEVYEDSVIDHTLSQAKSTELSKARHAKTYATATIIPISPQTRLNALRPESLKDFNLDEAKERAQALLNPIETVDHTYTLLEAFEAMPLRYEGGRALIRGRGCLSPQLVVIGDAPDPHEDLAGQAFSGPIGQMTDKVLKGLKLMDQTYLLPALFWRATGGRPATQEDINITAPFVLKLLEILKPQRVLVLGATAAKLILDTSEPILTLRSKPHPLRLKGGHDVSVFVSFAPSLWLNQPLAKAGFWQDSLIATEGLEGT